MSRYILHDYLQIAGGAERLVLDAVAGLDGYRLAVSRVYPEARFLSSLVDERVTSLGTTLTGMLPRVMESAACFAFRTRFLRDADRVLYSGIYAPLAVARQGRGKRVYYCHTPPRYLYDWRARYVARVPVAGRPFAEMAFGAFQKNYEASVAAMDVVVANSHVVRRRMEKYLGVKAEVIHPPIDTERFTWVEGGDYFVSLARLEPHKRVDLIIQAFLDMPKRRLVVASGGSEEARLRALAAGADNISFAGWQTDEELCRMIGSARAAIYVPLEEDFGMSAVEAMAAGKPVIGVVDGGLSETVIHGETGVLLSEPVTAEAIAIAVDEMTAVRAAGMRVACETRSWSFSRSMFLERLKAVLD